jgi:hypothetical protein
MIKIVKDILEIFDKNGLWEEDVELIGSWCFLLYQKYYGVKKYPLRTTDIDFLIPFPYKGKKNIHLIKFLETLGFRLDFNTDGSLFLKNAELKIEFLSPEKGWGSEKPFEIKKLSLKTTPLRFLDMLLKDKLIVKEDTLNISIPSPLNFCLHKLLIAQRREKNSKKINDIEQAVYVLEVIDLVRFKNEYNNLPKKSKRYIMQSLEEAKIQVPLKEDVIDRAIITLQKQ